jgi:uncharacterized protein YndB with AHSA1/START domain
MQHEETRAVAAPAEVVWRILTDLERWPAWTRSMSKVEPDGPLAVGMTARVKQPRLPAVTWTVTDVDQGRSFTWEAAAPGLRTVAEHVVADGAAGTSTITLRIDTTGPAAGMMGLLLGGMTRRYVAMEADGLQREATV